MARFTTWLVQHQSQIVGSFVSLILFLRSIPHETWQRLERDFPRLANGVRAVRAIFPDVEKFGRALVRIWTGKPWDSAVPSDPSKVGVRSLALAIVALVASMLSGCSASEVRRQAVIANTTAVSSNTALDLIAGFESATEVKSIYERQQMDVIEAACGGASPCADEDAAREAVRVVRARWAPVWAAWSLAGVAVTVWSEQLRKCQTAQSNAGTDCSVRVEALMRSALGQIKTVRCALRELNVPDPFPGEVTCGGAQ